MNSFLSYPYVIDVDLIHILKLYENEILSRSRAKMTVVMYDQS